MRWETRGSWAMQPHRAMTISGFSFFAWVRAPRLPNTRSSACSRTAQVFRMTRSASAGLSVKVKLIASSMPISFWPSATFCWQPKVSTQATGWASRAVNIPLIFSSNSRWRARSASGTSTLFRSKVVPPNTDTLTKISYHESPESTRRKTVGLCVKSAG